MDGKGWPCFVEFGPFNITSTTVEVQNICVYVCVFFYFFMDIKVKNKTYKKGGKK